MIFNAVASLVWLVVGTLWIFSDKPNGTTNGLICLAVAILYSCTNEILRKIEGLE